MTTLSKTTLASALFSAAALAAVALGNVGTAYAGPAAVPEFDNEKCYGISKAGKNDCQFSSGSCAGTATADSLKDTWLYVPAGTCERIVGASLEPLI
ncbi:MAG: BufA1 family periplasmic bufferin-type metallophore [Alphaproteobacteria bacterium]